MSDLFFIGSLFCAFISAYMLLFKKNNQQYFSDKILATLFLSYSYCTIGYLLISSGWIIQFPSLYRTSAPVNYLVPPLAYLYVRSVLKNEYTWHWKDALHLLPFVFIAINYIPLFAMTYDKKLIVAKLVVDSYNNNYVNQDGFFSENIQLLRPLQSLIYIILQWKLIRSFEKQNSSAFFQLHTKLILSWLKKFTLAITFTILTYLIFIIGVVYGLSTHQKINNLVLYASIPVAISLFYLTSYLIINPKVLFGLPYIEYIINNKLVEVLNKTKYEAEIADIEKFFKERKPYLKQGFSINELSMELDIPAKLVSFIINNHFDKNFNDFVNAYRIAHLIERIKMGDFKLLTLNAIALQSGFSNKTTFLNAFKKVHHCTPSVYLQNLNINLAV
jgi:AraC-like DNA-binding protein